MILNLKAYSAYRDSSVEWLDAVPAHWKVRRLKRIARLNPSKSEVPLAMRNDPAVFLPMERVGSDGRFDASEVRPISALWNGFTYFRRGDVIVAKITPCFENGKGACLDNLPTALGFGSTEFHVIRPSKVIVSAYLYRVTTLSEFRRLGADEMTGAAGQQRVPVEFIANFPIPIPPLPEQTAIVRFLDYRDRRIRRSIRAKQKLIKLLEEYRQALIHQAVTGKIDVRTGKPYAAYKRSGVPWLSKVPAHWEVRRLKTVCRLTYGAGLAADFRQDGAVPVYGSNGRVGYHTTANTKAPCIIIGRKGSFGKVNFSTDPVFAIDTTFFIDSRFTSSNLRWLYYLLDSLKLDEVTKDSAIPGLDREDAYRELVPVPPLPEQTAIVEYLDAQTAKLDTAIAAARREIELLREYRERLIADVVTGKVDVREVAAQLPEEPPEEVELLEEEAATGEADGEDAKEETDDEE